MNNRPYLDKLVTSPHIPKQEGQTGYCSRHIIPDLSCAGIHSEFEPKTIPIITADGKMTKVFVMNAHRTMRELQRGIVKQNAQEEIFKLDHRQYIDKLLLDMEGSKRDKHERRMRHWKSSKDAMGFGGSFEGAFTGESSTKWQAIENTGGKSEFSSEDSRGVSPMNIADEYPEDADFEEARQNAVANANAARSSTRSHINRSNTDSPLPRVGSSDTRDTRNSSNSHALHSVASHRSFGSQASQGSHGFSRPASDKEKKVRAHSRMALFTALLDTVEPPTSPKKRFGSIIITKNEGVAGRNGSSFGETGSTRLGNSIKK